MIIEIAKRRGFVAVSIDGGDRESSLNFLVDRAVLPHPVPHRLIDGLVPDDVAQDVLVKDTPGLDLPLGFVVFVVV